MQRKGANISLKGYDDIFSTEQSRAESQQERVQEIPLSELHPFEGHPFRVVDDEEMWIFRIVWCASTLRSWAIS
jgi:ParB family chromosome partitioning protein